MKCFKCGGENQENATFCIQCGANLREVQNENAFLQTESIQQSPPINIPNNTMQTTMPNQPMPSPSVSKLNYPMYMLAILLKPIRSFQEEEEKFTSPKTAFLLSLFMVIFMTIASLIQTIFQTVRVASFSLSSGYTTTFQWENLKNLNWFTVIGKDFLIAAGLLFAIAGVFYLGSFLVKKQFNFLKSLAITATAIFPFIVLGLFLSPIFGMIWSPLGLVLTVISIFDSFLILFELMNRALQLEGDIKVYFNVACFSILIIAGYYIYINLILNPVATGMDQIMEMFQ